MSKISKDGFKASVISAFEERGCSKIRLSMALFGMQCDVSYHQDGCFGKQEAHVSLKEKDRKQLLKIEQRDGTDWECEIRG